MRIRNLFSRSVPAMVAAALATPGAWADEFPIPFGSVWKYRDDGSDQGTAWSGLGFDDSSWASGPGELGYGDGDEATVVGYGPDSGNKYITTYFRREFSVADAAQVRSLTLRVRRDDGVVLYVNGVEVFRNNMPAGAIDYLTEAQVAIGSEEERRVRGVDVDPALLVTGNNVVAAEIHQNSGSSSDISFELEAHTVFVGDPPQVLRGPYLQRLAPDQVTVRWRTDVATDSVLEYGRVLGQLDQTVSDPALVTEHELVVTGLTARTLYQYAYGDSFSGRFGGDDGEHTFETSPEHGDTRAFRVWVLGDFGTADENAAAVRDAYLAHSNVPTDFWLMLGDNAYPQGTDDDYQEGVFRIYPSILQNVPVFSTLGNHDGINADSDTQSGVYYDVFTLPAQAESGGLASGTEAYYSFDYDNVHFVCLDSFDSPRTAGSPMLTWLEADLASTDQDWIVAFFHHPPYTKGSHDSDNILDSGGSMVDMREQALPILEDAGVDLVLSGHSHSYERSMLIDRHYGFSPSFGPQNQVDSGDGRPSGDGGYHKESQGLAPHEGTVYVVTGDGGKVGGGRLDHPVMVYSASDLGSVILDFEGNRLDATFLRETGAVDDTFQIVKGPADPGAEPRSFTATFADGTTGGLRVRSGAVDVRKERLELSSSARIAFPPASRQEPQFLTRVAAGMPVRASVGFEIPVDGFPSAPTGLHHYTVDVVHRGGGEVFARLHRDDDVIARGPVVKAGADVHSFVFRGGIRDSRVRVWIDDVLALDTPLPPATLFADTVSLVSHQPQPGLLRLEWVSLHEQGVVPSVHFDEKGRLWLELYAPALDRNFDPSQFLFTVGEDVWTWGRFLNEVLPLFDRVEESRPEHLLIGLTPPLSSGTRAALRYGPAEDADAQRH